MTQLADFVLLRIAEDEAEASTAIAMRDACSFVYEPTVPDLSFDALEDLAVPALILGPERALAECRSKRRIVELFEMVSESGTLHADAWVMSKQAVLEVAAIYSHHPDYRQEWKP